MRSHLLVGLSTLGLALTGAAVLTPAEASVPQAAAPDGPGTKTVWTEANKAGFGTARTRRQQRLVHAAAAAGSARCSTPTCRRRACAASSSWSPTGGRSPTASPTRHATCARRGPTPRSLRFHAGRHRDRPAATGSSRRTSPTRAATRWTCGSASSSLDGGQLPALRRRTTRRWPTPAWTTAAAPRTHSGGRRRNGSSRRALASRPAFGADHDRARSVDERRLDRPRGRPAPRPAATPSAGPGNVVQAGRVSGVTGQRGHQLARR